MLQRSWIFLRGFDLPRGFLDLAAARSGTQAIKKRANEESGRNKKCTRRQNYTRQKVKLLLDFVDVFVKRILDFFNTKNRTKNRKSVFYLPFSRRPAWGSSKTFRSFIAWRGRFFPPVPRPALRKACHPGRIRPRYRGARAGEPAMTCPADTASTPGQGGYPRV